MGKADKPEKNKKNQKHFWKDFKAELKKVNWPTRSQVINNTVVVLVIVAIVTALCFVLDLAFEALNTYGIDKLKSAVQNSVSNTVENVVDNNTVGNNIVDGNTVQNDTNQVADENRETNQVTNIVEDSQE